MIQPQFEVVSTSKILQAMIMSAIVRIEGANREKYFVPMEFFVSTLSRGLLRKHHIKYHVNQFLIHKFSLKLNTLPTEQEYILHLAPYSLTVSFHSEFLVI